MPHYQDGAPAEIGDFVVGTPYNVKHEIVGTIIQIAEDTESCNCVVAFCEPVITDLPVHDFHRRSLPIPPHIRRIEGGRVPHCEHDFFDRYENVVLHARYDYGETRSFRKVGL